MCKEVRLKKMVLIILFSLCIIFPVKADSGWDSDYDSGSSWDSSSSSGGYDYNDHSSHSSRSSNSGSYAPHKYYNSFFNGLEFILGIIVFFSIILLFVFYIKLFTKFISSIFKQNKHTLEKEEPGMSDAKLKLIDPTFNKSKFKMEIFNLYKSIQTAWMNFDNETIRKLTTDEIYNMYSSQLETLKLKNEQNIMKNIDYVNAKIINLTKNNNLYIASVILNVKVLDYVINITTNNVLRGDNRRRINITYIITLVKTTNANVGEIVTCPNCGANAKMASSGICEYCGSVLVHDSSKWVMSKKECINQRKD